MICSQDDAPCSHINPRKIQEHIEHCNLAWILFIKRITVTFVVAHGPLTSINQTCASILAIVYVLLCRAVTEYRWGGSRNILFIRHKFLVLTVKKLLKSAYIYGSYRKIKTGVSLFWTTRYSPSSPFQWSQNAFNDLQTWFSVFCAGFGARCVCVH